MAGASRAGGAPGDRSGARAGVALWLGLVELARGRDEDALAELDPRESENGEMRAALAALWLAQPIGRGDPAPAPVIDGSAPPWNPRSWSAQAFLLEAIAHDALRRPAAAGRALEQLGGPQVTARDHQVRLTGNDITNDGAYIRRPGAGVRCRGPRSALPYSRRRGPAMDAAGCGRTARSPPIAAGPRRPLGVSGRLGQKAVPWAANTLGPASAVSAATRSGAGMPAAFRGREARPRR